MNKISVIFLKLRLIIFIHLTIMLLLVGVIGKTVHAYPIMLNVTYSNPVILTPTPAPPIPIPYPNLVQEITAYFQFDSSELPALGESSEVSNMISASMVFGDADLTVADLFKTNDDDVHVLPNFTIGLDSAGEINLLQYAFSPVNTQVVDGGIVLNSFFELNFKGTYIPTQEEFHIQYQTSSQSLTALTADPVPEPATIALLGIGLVGLAGAEVRRRRKKAKAIRINHYNLGTSHGESCMLQRGD